MFYSLRSSLIMTCVACICLSNVSPSSVWCQRVTTIGENLQIWVAPQPVNSHLNYNNTILLISSRPSNLSIIFQNHNSPWLRFRGSKIRISLRFEQKPTLHRPPSLWSVSCSVSGHPSDRTIPCMLSSSS